MANCQELYLHRNQIGDAGVMSLDAPHCLLVIRYGLWCIVDRRLKRRARAHMGVHSTRAVYM